jgi:hypothetical protein
MDLFLPHAKTATLLGMRMLNKARDELYAMCTTGQPVTWARPRRKATGVWQAATQDLSKLWKPSQEPRPLPERRV